jgi:hypothetical protein
VKPTGKAAFLASEGDEVTNRTTDKPRHILRESDLATDRATDTDLHPFSVSVFFIPVV